MEENKLEEIKPSIEFVIENIVDTETHIFNAVVIELNMFYNRKINSNQYENYIEIQNNSIDKIKNLLEELKIKIY